MTQNPADIPEDILEYMNGLLEFQDVNIKKFNAMLWYDFLMKNADDLKKLEEAFPIGQTAGTRYPEKQLHLMGF